MHSEPLADVNELVEEESCRCEWCGEVVPDGDSDYPPYCSRDCEQDATAETYASVHPRPEEVA